MRLGPAVVRSDVTQRTTENIFRWVFHGGHLPLHKVLQDFLAALL